MSRFISGVVIAVIGILILGLTVGFYAGLGVLLLTTGLLIMWVSRRRN